MEPNQRVSECNSIIILSQALVIVKKGGQMRLKIYNQWLRSGYKQAELKKLLASPLTEAHIVGNGIVPDAAIEKLSAREQQIIYDRFVLLRTHPQIGQQLNISRSRVGQLEFRALRIINQTLEDMNGNSTADNAESTDNN